MSIGGRISGVQIRLDNPVDGRKYFWLSSANDNMGVTSGSPVHFVGDPTSKVVYITEGPLKADIAHCLCGKTFAAVAGVNQHTRLNAVFQVLKQNGTQEIVEAYDMDKFQNEHVQKGCERLYELAAEHGFKVTRLKWDSKYKGIDDWQLSVNKKPIIKEIQNMAKKKYRVYQVVLENKEKCPALAFQGLSVMRECGYNQPPAAFYELVYDSSIPCGDNDSDMVKLEQIFELLNVNHPSDYRGRSLH